MRNQDHTGAGTFHCLVLGLWLSEGRFLGATQPIYMGGGSRRVVELMGGEAEGPYGWAGSYPVCAERGYADTTTPATHEGNPQAWRASGALQEHSGRAA